MSVSEAIVESLFKFFSSNPTSQSEAQQLLNIQEKTLQLFAKDYCIGVIANTNGEICTTYPHSIFIIRSTKTQPTQEINDPEILRDLFQRACLARVRQRFPVPVILYKDRNICRSSTLADASEAFLNSVSTDPLRFSSNGVGSHRSVDIRLLETLGVLQVCDLMVENKKRKYGITVSSSEKIDQCARYSGFRLNSMPYPGTEFFSAWKEKGHFDRMKIDWNEFGTDSVTFRTDPLNPNPFSEDDWQSWDIAMPDSKGILIHCISGWDRTPLYTSLIRISLWADGEAHESLSALEMTYLTLAYDWLLFNHYFVDRTNRGEDIFYFCIHMLPFLIADEFSIHSIARQSNNSPSLRSESSKISIRNVDERTGVADCGSLGTLNSWECIYGTHMRQNIAFSFLDHPPAPSIRDNDFDCLESPRGTVRDSKNKSDDVDDELLMFDLDEEGSDFITSSSVRSSKQESVDPETSFVSVDSPPTKNTSLRAQRLKEIHQKMMELYSSFIFNHQNKTKPATTQTKAWWTWS